MFSFKKMSYEKCWQFMNCDIEMRKDCIVYKTGMKEPCWVLNQVGGSGVLNACKTCQWFLKNK